VATGAVKEEPTLTIGQLAAHTGVTVRAIRHYHHLGLLAEPGRDASGYRRYDAQAVVDLIRIKTLAAAGVPLARIDPLLQAEPDQFAEAITAIDRDLVERIRQLTRQRRGIAQLAAGEQLLLPAEIVEILDRQRALGHSERMIRIERDVWIMAVALSPRSVPDWVAAKNAALQDPEFRRLYLACDRALDWDPHDPRLVELAHDITTWDSRRAKNDGTDPGLAELMRSHTTTASPAWQRLAQLLSSPSSTASDSPRVSSGAAGRSRRR
jgi:DNA-binding transcriptional MerR regulator